MAVAISRMGNAQSTWISSLGWLTSTFHTKNLQLLLCYKILFLLLYFNTHFMIIVIFLDCCRWKSHSSENAITMSLFSTMGSSILPLGLNYYNDGVSFLAPTPKKLRMVLFVTVKGFKRPSIRGKTRGIIWAGKRPLPKWIYQSIFPIEFMLATKFVLFFLCMSRLFLFTMSLSYSVFIGC